MHEDYQGTGEQGSAPQRQADVPDFVPANLVDEVKADYLTDILAKQARCLRGLQDQINALITIVERIDDRLDGR